MKYQDYKYYFFIGISGIGMSSLAKYLNLKNKQIAGYDREKTEISKNLEKAGIDIYIIMILIILIKTIRTAN